MRIFNFILLAVIGLLLTANYSYSQTVNNPTAVEFTSPDHNVAETTGYEIDIVQGSTVVQTLTVAKANTTVLSNGDIHVNVSVQPIKFGTYTVVVRTIAGSLKSSNSLASDPWNRVPGAPGKPIVK